MLPMITTNIPNNEYWEKAVRIFLKNPDSIIANPSLLSDEYNEWMLQEAAIIQQDELEEELAKLKADKEGAEWTAYSERNWALINSKEYQDSIK